jgi:hypothetical protein
MRTVIVSTNNNEDYKFFVPYMEKAWNSLGWRLCVMVTHDVDVSTLKLNDKNNIVIKLPHIEGLRTESIAQAGRLYAGNYFDHDMLMTSDMDLLPLQDYWNPTPFDVTVYGHDLTWRSYIPMGYVAMDAIKWRNYMKLTGDTEKDMRRDANEFKHLAYAPDWESWWNWDWTQLTERLMPFKKDLTLIDRGQIDIAGATLAKGRVDRYNWKETQQQPDWIDAHCHNNNVMHPDKQRDFLEVFEKVYGKL